MECALWGSPREPQFYRPLGEKKDTKMSAIPGRRWAQHSPPAPVSSELLFYFVFWLHMGYVYCAGPIEPTEPHWLLRHRAPCRTAYEF